MSLSLREQLLQAGLVTEKQARQAERDEHQQRRRDARVGGRKPPLPQTQPAPQPAPGKRGRDLELNRRQQEKAAAKARAAELRQLVGPLRVPRPESDDYYNFVDAGKIRRLAVTPDLRARLAAGRVLIVRCDGRYDLVPTEAAERIRERHPDAIVALPAAAADPAPPVEDDPYKDYLVPDDLTW